MATKGIQANGIAEKNALKAREGQEEKAAARRARKAQQANRQAAPVVTSAKPTPVNEQALHVLFSRTRKVLAENHRTRTPGSVLAQSHELIRACRLHGWQASLKRIMECAVKCGMDEHEAVKMGMEATKAFRS